MRAVSAIVCCCCCFLMAGRFRPAEPRYVPANATDAPEEVQHALCSISAGDLEANANATVVRQLHGVCTNSHLDDRLDRLQRELTGRIDSLRDAVLNAQLLRSAPVRALPVVVEGGGDGDGDGDGDSEDDDDDALLDAELGRNMTLRTAADGSIAFLYYWRVGDLYGALRRNEPLESSHFQLSGHDLSIRLYPNAPAPRHVSFGLAASHGFDMPHTFSVLHRDRGGGGGDDDNDDDGDADADITSGMLRGCRQEAGGGGKETRCARFSVPHSLIASKRYRHHNGAVLVKLSVYLKL